MAAAAIDCTAPGQARVQALPGALPGPPLQVRQGPCTTSHMPIATVYIGTVVQGLKRHLCSGPLDAPGLLHLDRHN